MKIRIIKSNFSFRWMAISENQIVEELHDLYEIKSNRNLENFDSMVSKNERGNYIFLKSWFEVTND